MTFDQFSRAFMRPGAVVVAAAALAVADSASAQSPDEWVERITSSQKDDPAAWRDYFALGQELAELPGREGLKIVKEAWPLIQNVRLKQQIIKAWQFDLPAPFRTRMHPHAFEFFAFVLDQDDEETHNWVMSYLSAYAWRTFAGVDEAAAWLNDQQGRSAADVAISSMERWIDAVRNGPTPAAHVNMLPEIRHPLRRNTSLQDAGRAMQLEAALLKAFEDPAVTTEAISYGYFMLGELRPDAYPSDGLDAFLEPFADRRRAEEEVDRARLLASLDFRSLDGDERKRWIAHPPISESQPAKGWGLLIVAPGGAGTADFAPFVRDTIRPAAGDDYIVLQLIAPPIEEDDGNAIVWPRKLLKDDRVEFTMEPVVAAAIDETMREQTIDPGRIWIMGWSSGGPLAYEMAVTTDSPIRGAFVIMSVFKPELTSPLAGAAGRSFYILHSPDDFINMRFPREAERLLGEAGARVTLQTYEGGHGWHGDIAAQISSAVRWLEGAAD